MQGNGSPNGDDFSNRKKKDMIDILFSENWKQQQLIKKNGKHRSLTKVVLGAEVLSAMMLVLIAAGTGGSMMVVPAIAAGAYTVATVNNSLDRNLHGLIGFLDSPVSSSTLFYCSNSLFSLDDCDNGDSVFDGTI